MNANRTEIATERERRTLLDRVVVFADHLEVSVHGAPRLNVALAEVGLDPREQILACRRGDLNPHVLADTRPST
jgi:hypothetical protein